MFASLGDKFVFSFTQTHIHKRNCDIVLIPQLLIRIILLPKEKKSSHPIHMVMLFKNKENVQCKGSQRKVDISYRFILKSAVIPKHKVRVVDKY